MYLFYTFVYFCVFIVLYFCILLCFYCFYMNFCNCQQWRNKDIQSIKLMKHRVRVQKLEYNFLTRIKYEFLISIGYDLLNYKQCSFVNGMTPRRHFHYSENNCLPTVLPCSQSSFTFFARVPNFGEAAIRMFNCLSFDKEEIIKSFPR